MTAMTMIATACDRQRTTVSGGSAQSDGGSSPSIASGPSTSTTSSATTDDAASYITVRSLNELVAKSQVIAVGQLSTTAETINMARDPSDPTKPDPEYSILGQVYRVAIQRYVKGNGGSTLDVVQPEGFLGQKTPKTQENLNKARHTYEFVPFHSGTKYLLFLEPVRGFPGKSYFTGPAQPWRFTVPDGGTAVPESPWKGASQAFPPMPTTSLLGQVEQQAQGQR